MYNYASNNKQQKLAKTKCPISKEYHVLMGLILDIVYPIPSTYGI